MIKFQPREKTPKEDWDDLVSNSKDGWYFATYCWNYGISQISPWMLQEFSFSCYENDSLVAIVPLHFDVRSKYLRSSGFGWSGPVFKNSASKKAVKEVYKKIDAIGERVKAIGVEIGLTPISEYCSKVDNLINPFIHHGYDDVSSYSQVINFEGQTKESLWNGLSTTACQQIRKAQKNLTVKKIDWSKHLEHYYNLHKENYTKTGMQPHPFSYFEMIANNSNKNHELYAVFDEDNKIIAYQNCLRFKKSSYYHTGTSSAEALMSGANYLLMWEVINDSLSRGYKDFELGEICFAGEDKLINISFFKTRFGGKLHRYFKARKTFKKTLIFPKIHWLLSKIERVIYKIKVLFEAPTYR